MNETLREAIGKALFEQLHHDPWKEEPDTIKEIYRYQAEKVVEAYKTIEQELSQKILGIAQNALQTGGTWSEADRIGMLVEALEDIIKEVSRDERNETTDPVSFGDEKRNEL